MPPDSNILDPHVFCGICDQQEVYYVNINVS